MRFDVCTVRDAKSEIYGRPMFFQSVGAAVRSFSDEVNRESEDNIMFRHPEDFALYHLGTWDDNTAQFTTQVERFLINAIECKNQRIREQGVSVV